MSKRTRLVLIALAAVLLLAAIIFEGELGIMLANQRPDAEAARLAASLGLDGDEVVAEMGAGLGRLTVAVARLVPRGRVHSTELNQDRLADIRAHVEEAGLRNVEVREAALEGTNLPDTCCDAVFMRTVYHHFTNPPVMVDAIHRALKPDGRLAIIEFEPRGVWKWFEVPGDVPDRGGHGVPMSMLVREVTGRGRFRLEATIDRWAGSLYLMIFRRIS